MDNSEIKKFKEAGVIAKQAVDYARGLIKPGVLLLEIAEKIEAKIIELGGKPAFPVNLSINEIAAHYTPAFNDETMARGLLKVDIGVHKEGYVADTAFSIDLENSAENKALIEAAENALAAALKTIARGATISQIGKAVDSEITKKGFQSVHNLSGHSIEVYNLHSGITIPNYDNSSPQEIEDGVYAIEPFSTNGLGSVRDGRPSGIYKIESDGNVRDSFARGVATYIVENYQTLPFCARWIYKKFGTRGLLALRQIEAAGILHHYAQLVESGKGKVAQAEHTVIISEKEKIVTTK